MGSLTQRPSQRTGMGNPNTLGEMAIPEDELQLRRLLEEEDRSISEIIVRTFTTR